MMSSKGVIGNTSSLSLLLLLIVQPQKIKLLYRILFLYYVTLKITQDDGGDVGSTYYVYVSSSLSTFDHDDDSMSTINSYPYHPINRKSTTLVERNVQVVSSYNNTKCLTAEPFVLGSTIVVNLTSLLLLDGAINFFDYCRTSTYCSECSYPGLWYKFIGTGVVYSIQSCNSDYPFSVAVFSGNCSQLECITLNDNTIYNFTSCSTGQSIDQSLNSPFQTQLGRIYYVFVGRVPFYGELTTISATGVDVSIQLMPNISLIDNYSCTNATMLTNNQTVVVSTLGSVQKYSKNCENFPSPMYSNGVWYKLPYSAVGMRYVIEACGSTNTGNSQIYVSLFVSGPINSCSNLRCVNSTLSPCPGNVLSFDTNTLYEQYYLFVSSMVAETITLRVRATSPVNICTDAIPYPLGLRVLVDSRDVSDTTVVPDCFEQSISGPGIWYKVIGTGRTITAQPLIKKANTGINIYTGTCGTNYNALLDLQCIAVNNKICYDVACGLGSILLRNEHVVKFDSIRGTTYYIKVISETNGLTPILIQSGCELNGLQIIFCPFTSNGIFGLLLKRLFYEFGKLTGKN